MKDVAKALIDAGWAVVPLNPPNGKVPGKDPKAPCIDNWRAVTFTPADFRPDVNIGVKSGPSSGNRIAIDLDCPEAVRVASELMPRTLSHGRASKRISQMWYTVEGVGAGKAYADPVTKKHIVHVRGEGFQSCVPPSIHPDTGEQLIWNDEGTPVLTLSKEELTTAVLRVVIVALFSRYWPSESRHYASGHVGGFLARLDFPAAEVERMVRLMAEIAGDEEASDRARFARESAEKHAAGEKTTGGKSILDAFEHGAKLLRAVYGWMGRDGDDEIDRLNTKHFVVRIGKNMAVGTEESSEVVLQNFTDFQQMYFNQWIGKKKLGLAWLEHPQRRTYRSVVFAPPGSRVRVSADDYNLWLGFAVSPDPNPLPESRCARFLSHTHDVVCEGVTAHYEYVLDLLADIVQAPGRPIGKALVLRGGPGVGKSVFFEAVGQLFGPRHFITVTSREQLVGKFNAHLSGKVVVFADEAVWGGDKRDAGTLKRIITQDTITIERKGVDVVAEPNCVHLFMATNEDWAYPVMFQERRAVILDILKQKRPAAYFSALWAEIEHPAFAPALLAVLQARQIHYIRLREGLDTAAMREVQDISAEPVQQWWKMMLEDGRLMPLADPSWPGFVTTDYLYERFTIEMGSQRGAGYTHRGTRLQFTKRIKALLPATAAVCDRVVEVNMASFGPPIYKKALRRGFELPPLESCRQHYNSVSGAAHVWPRPVEDETNQSLFPG